jgi:UPF0042 nucleotide-binding protein
VFIEGENLLFRAAWLGGTSGTRRRRWPGRFSSRTQESSENKKRPLLVEELRMHDGHNQDVMDYVLRSEECRVFIEKLFALMAFLIPRYEKEGKTTLNIALGCTGGRHRSVVIANQLGSYFSSGNYHVNITHRDITKS